MLTPLTHPRDILRTSPPTRKGAAEAGLKAEQELNQLWRSQGNAGMWSGGGQDPGLREPRATPRNLSGPVLVPATRRPDARG